MTDLKRSKSLTPFFQPETVAVYGASSTPGKFGYELIRALKSDGYPGRIVAVGRGSGEVLGLPIVRSANEDGAVPDLALVALPADAVPDTLIEASQAGARASVVYASGFAERGAEGAALQDRLLDTLATTGLRLIGPNCLGIRSFHDGLNASLVRTAAPMPGTISFLAQSGSFGNVAYNEFGRRGLGLSISASLGNSIDVSPTDLIEYAATDENTEVIAVFMEGATDSERLLDVVSAVTPHKPIVMLRAGVSPLGQRAALSHTSAIAGDARVLRALLHEAGVTLVDSMQELFDVTAGFALAKGRYPKSRRTAIFTVAGGPGVLAADHVYAEGLELPDLGTSLEYLRERVAPFASLTNPIDVTGSTPRDSYASAVAEVAAHPQVDAVLAISMGLDYPEYADGIIAVDSVPVLGSILAPNMETRLREAGVANYPTPERAVRVLRHLAEYGEKLTAEAAAAPDDAVPQLTVAPGILTEAEAKRFLASAGLPITREAVIDGIEQAWEAASDIGYPLAVKVSSAEVPHKSDAGGVLLGITDDDALRDAVEILAERFPGASVLIQEMVPPGVEVLIGARRAESIPAHIVIGLGGVLTEILNDIVILRAPASREAVLKALDNLKSSRLLDGYRGAPGLDRAELAAVASRLSAVFAGNVRIEELDLNPVIGSGDRLRIVDALIKVI